MMGPRQEVSEVDVALDSMAAEVGRLARDKAVGAAKLATAQQRIAQLQADLTERDATIAALSPNSADGVEAVVPPEGGDDPDA